MACRSQNNPNSSSSDSVPPELEMVGSREILFVIGLTGLSHRSDRSAQDFAAADRFDDHRVF